MIIINDNDYSNPYDKSNDDKKINKRMNSKNTTSNVCGSKNNDDRNYENIKLIKF